MVHAGQATLTYFKRSDRVCQAVQTQLSAGQVGTHNDSFAFITLKGLQFILLGNKHTDHHKGWANIWYILHQGPAVLVQIKMSLF